MKEKAATTPTRILLVDDHPVFCLGMTQLINMEKDLLVINGSVSGNTIIIPMSLYFIVGFLITPQKRTRLNPKSRSAQ